MGWLFPIDGPFDSAYDRYEESIKKSKSPSKPAPIIKEKPIYIDLDEDDVPEWYMLVPLTEGEKGE